MRLLSSFSHLFKCLSNHSTWAVRHTLNKSRKLLCLWFIFTQIWNLKYFYTHLTTRMFLHPFDTLKFFFTHLTPKFFYTHLTPKFFYTHLIPKILTPIWHLEIFLLPFDTSNFFHPFDNSNFFTPIWHL